MVENDSQLASIDDEEIVEVHTTGLGGINKGNAHNMVIRRFQLARKAGAEGMAKAVVETLEAGGRVPTPMIPVDAWSAVMQHATKVYMKSNSLRGMSEMANFIGKNTGMIAPESAKEVQTPDLGLLGLDDAKVILQVNNYYQKDYKNDDPELDIIEGELNDLNDEG